MTQYNQIKARYPDALLLFRVGDFYETFGADAVETSRVLGIVLTKRANGSASHIELAGFPHHSLESYLPRLVRAGYRVAICDQLEDPKATKGIVKRGVTELVTPGVSFNDQVLHSRSNNFLLSLHEHKGHFGVALIDVSTGEFLVSEGNTQDLQHWTSIFNPSEILYQRGGKLPSFLEKKPTARLEDWAFQYQNSYERLNQHFETLNLKGFGVEELELGLTAAGAILHYLVDSTHHNLLGHIRQIRRIPMEDHLLMDNFTLRNLEVVQATHPRGKSMLEVVDQTLTPMGARLLRRRIILPLSHRQEIERRLNLVDFFVQNSSLNEEIRNLLAGISDLDRLIGKLASDRISPREMGHLRNSLQIAQQIRETLHPYHDLPAWMDVIESMDSVLDYLHNQLQEDLPVNLSKGNVIMEGVNKELDQLRQIQSDSKNYLEELRIREAENTGISSLKVDFNNVFGYFIEVRNTHKNKVPENWIRKQTLVNAERYITEELKEYEEKILGATDRILSLENEIYAEIRLWLLEYLDVLQINTRHLAALDCATALANLALEKNYVKPKIKDQIGLDLKGLRHPIIEASLPPGHSYVPNDLKMIPDKEQIRMITGPNMSGKSAILRQTALCVILAQMGSFVPAQSASIGLTDRIFTRVGASDNLSEGESTFMVEMNEAASILNNLSDRSLILLDEIGRGTATYDGVSIAWAIAEYLHEHPTRPLTLFATHYHELNAMEASHERIKNYHIAIQRHEDQILFLRTLEPGGSEHSFGIQVARMAGMPKWVLERASQILESLENQRGGGSHHNREILSQEQMQLSFFQLDDPILEEIRSRLEKLDVNVLTPMEALIKLNEIKNLLRPGK